jgi:hypothetical protein
MATHSMLAILHLLGTFIANLFKSRRRLEVDALRRAPQRLRLRGSDWALLAWMTWLQACSVSPRCSA